MRDAVGLSCEANLYQSMSPRHPLDSDSAATRDGLLAHPRITVSRKSCSTAWEFILCVVYLLLKSKIMSQSTNTSATLMTTRQTREQHKDKRILYASQEEVMETGDNSKMSVGN